ncbi:MAG: hypothetical protein ACE5FC_00505, partial [Myxococcota bacterium]
DFGRAPSRSRTPRDATSAASDSGAAAPAPPRKQKPFTYAPAPRSQGTVTGYDAAVAPRTITLDPATPPVPAGPNAAPARPLPRLAPYGRSLPPSKSTPPASIPR